MSDGIKTHQQCLSRGEATVTIPVRGSHCQLEGDSCLTEEAGGGDDISCLWINLKSVGAVTISSDEAEPDLTVETNISIKHLKKKDCYA